MIADPGPDGTLSGDPHLTPVVVAEGMGLPFGVVVVAVDPALLAPPPVDRARRPNHAEHRVHHQLPVDSRRSPGPRACRPRRRRNPGSVGPEVGQVPVLQGPLQVAAHLAWRSRCGPWPGCCRCPGSPSARTAPEVLALVEADLDEVVAAPERVPNWVPIDRSSAWSVSSPRSVVEGVLAPARRQAAGVARLPMAVEPGRDRPCRCPAGSGPGCRAGRRRSRRSRLRSCRSRCRPRPQRG